jgi:hypothetical protein
MEAMARHRSHSIAFKRQVAQELVSGETLHGLAKRHDISRNLILCLPRTSSGVVRAAGSGYLMRDDQSPESAGLPPGIAC